MRLLKKQNIFIIAILVFAFMIPIYAKDDTGKKNDDPQVNSQIPEEFLRIGEGLPPSKRRQLQMWIWKLQFEKPYSRMRASREIFWYKQKEAIPYLVVALRDTYWGVRQGAARALANIGVAKYSYTKDIMVDGTKLYVMRENLSKISVKDMSLAEKGQKLLDAEKNTKEKIEFDIIKELKIAYYRESQFFKDPLVKEEIRQAITTLSQKDQNDPNNNKKEKTDK